MHCQVRVIHLLYFRIVFDYFFVLLFLLFWLLTPSRARLSPVGITTNQPDGLQFLYEKHNNFGAFPTFGILLAQKAIVENEILTGGLPGAWRNLDFSKVIRKKILLQIFL